MADRNAEEGSNQAEEKQCRICLDGVDAEEELGRLIRPCLCRGSISYVHLGCLQRWRHSTPSMNTFFACPQCHYKYRVARTRVLGIASNAVLVGGLSALLFTTLTMFSSYVTTYFMTAYSDAPLTSYYGSYFYVSPLEVVSDLVRAALRIIQDDDTSGLLDHSVFQSKRASSPITAEGLVSPLADSASYGPLRRFITRFVVGLPLVGASSLIQMLMAAPFFGPVHWVARYRGNRRRNRDAKDYTAILIVALLIIGAARALYQVYQFSQKVSRWLLARMEDAILEVN